MTEEICECGLLEKYHSKFSLPCKKFTTKMTAAKEIKKLINDLEAGKMKPKNHSPQDSYSKNTSKVCMEDTPSDKVSSDTLCLPEGTQNQEKGCGPFVCGEGGYLCPVCQEKEE